MITWKTNTDVVGEIVGFVEGLENVFKDAAYLDRIATLAHNKASLEFDRAAAASAATGYIKHMYEYGTAGITPGKPMFSDPTDMAARLYVHNLAGSGGEYDVQYSFRPALVENPPREITTTRKTGSKYVKKLSKNKYIFHDRARLMETGAEVNIEPKNGRYLFIPAPEEAQGFVMWDTQRDGPLRIKLGRESKGNFTAFWEAWWASEGQAVIDKAVDIRVRTDANFQYTRLKNKSGAPKNPATANAEMEAIRKKRAMQVASAMKASAARYAKRGRR